MSVTIRMMACVVSLAATANLGPAEAQESEARTWCARKTDGVSPDLQISGCTTVIQSGTESKNDLATAFSNRGGAYSAKGQYDLAIQDFDQAIKFNPSNALALSNRGVAYTAKGQYDLAIQDFDQAIKLNPSNDIAFFNRGGAYTAKGRYDLAIQDFDQAIKLNPSNAVAFFNRGVAKAKMGDKEGADADFAAARRTNI